MKRIFLLFAVVLMLVMQPGWAGQPPQQLVESTADKVLNILKRDKQKITDDPQYLHGLVDEHVLPHFDFERMSRWVLGKYWKRANADERQRFVQEFRSLLVRTYATSLTEFTERKISYLPMRGNESDGDVTVRSEVDQPGGFPIPIEYKLHKNGADWKVYDVAIDGISLIANYRTSFAQEIRKTSIGQLIETLAAKNSKAGA